MSTESKDLTDFKFKYKLDTVPKDVSKVLKILEVSIFCGCREFFRDHCVSLVYKVNNWRDCFQNTRFIHYECLLTIQE